MSFKRIVALVLLTVAGLAMLGSRVFAQTQTVSQQAVGVGSPVVGNLTPEGREKLKSELEERLEGLKKANLPKEKLEKAQTDFARVLKVLADLEATENGKAAYLTNTAQIGKRLEEAKAGQQSLEQSKPEEFDDYTEQLRTEYKTQLTALQSEIQVISKRSSQGGIRVARIAEEIKQLEAKSAEIDGQLQKLGYASAQAGAPGADTEPMPEGQELDLQLQLVRAQIAMLKAEREWLTKSAPLEDALLSLNRLRFDQTEQALESINKGLAETIDAQRAALRARVAGLEQKLTASESRSDTILLTIQLATLEIMERNLDYRERLGGLRDELRREENLTGQMKRDKDRLVALMEKYGAGEWVAQRVMVDLEKFRREGQQQLAVSSTEESLQRELRVLNRSLFELGTRLFETDSEADGYREQIGQLTGGNRKQARAFRAEMNALMAQRKEALQQQEQILRKVADGTTKLIELNSQQEVLVDSLYTFVLSRMLWLRNREPIPLFPPNWELSQNAFKGVVGMSSRSATFLVSQAELIRSSFSNSSLPWIVAFIVFGVVPWVAAKLRRLLKARATQAMSDEGQPPGNSILALSALTAAIWPAYIVFVTWRQAHFVPLDDGVFGSALIGGLRVAALILWVLLLARALFRRGGFGERAWGLTPEACRSVRASVRVACIAGFLLWVPRYVILQAPEAGVTVEGSLAAARLLMIVFEVVIFALLVNFLRRGGPFIQSVLRKSRLQNGFVWVTWPIVYLAILGTLVGIIALNFMGYQYTSQYVWQRLVWSALIVLGFVLASSFVNSGIRSVLLAGLSSRARRRWSGEEGLDANVRFLFYLIEVPVWLLAMGIIVELWGFSILHFLVTPLGADILKRTAFIAIAIGVGIVVIYLSNATVMSLLRPRILAEGRTREASRQLQTIGPLIQTILKVVVILVVSLFVLELVGFETGPILAGVGIFGLAIGFAAQSLIKDVINGLFILFEGSLAVGEIVNVGGIGGQVEKVTLRSVRVRDLSGNVHFIPNSNIDRVQNMTKDFSRYLLDVGVAYREDTDEVVDIMREVDEEMRADPEYKWDMLEPIEIMGVDRFEDSAVVVRGRLKTRPIKQWRVGREFNRRLKKVFDARGIEIPFPHRTVYWGETKEGQPPLQVDVDRRRLKSKDGNAPPLEEGAPDEPTTVGEPETEPEKTADKTGC